MNTNVHVPDRRSYRFGSGLLAGTVVGAGLLMWLAPRIASELRERATETASRLRELARERYRDAGSQVALAVDEAEKSLPQD
jgi:gas vesicle protein